MATTNLKNKSVGFIRIQSGNGIPDHSEINGTLYTNVDTGIQYKNIGGTTWESLDLSQYYTSAQTDTNFLSANTSFYTQSQTNANFLSANTSIVSLSVYNTFTGSTAPNTYANISNLNNHTGNTSNPHNVTTSQISAYTMTESNTNFLSANTSIVSLSDYNTYTGTTAPNIYATIVNLNNHTGNTSNPHNTTLIQLSGVSLSTFNTYSGTTIPNTYATIVNLNNHTGNTSNPHNVTTSQISAYTMIEVDSNFLSANTSFVDLSTNQIIGGIKTFTGNVIINANLTVSGTTTTLNTENLNIKDNVILLNSGETGSGVTLGSGGINIDRGSLTNASLIFDDAGDVWKAGLLGSETEISLLGHNHNNLYYTETEVDSNFLSANTSFYTQNQANSNFLSANTSFYTQNQVDNLLTGITVDLSQYYTSAQTNSNFLSANTFIPTDFYSTSESDNNFLSANTSIVILSVYNTFTGTTAPSTYATITNLNNHTGNTSNPHNVALTQLSGVSLLIYNTYTGTTVPSTYATITNLNNHTGNTSNPHNVTTIQISAYTMIESNANFLSANTSFYTQSQANANFLSANTSFYTQSQANANFLSANTSIVSLSVYNTFTGTTVPNTYATITNLNSHTGNTSNPHNVNLTQLSGYTMTEVNNNFLSANTSFYTQSQANANFLSANTSYNQDKTIVLTTTAVVSHTGTSETVRYVSPVITGGTFTTGDRISFDFLATAVGLNGNKTFRTYFNGTPDLAGSPVLFQTFFTNQLLYEITKTAWVDSTTSMKSLNAGTTNSANGILGSSNSSMGTFAVDWTVDQYLVFSAQLVSASDTCQLESLFLHRNRL